MTASIPRSLDLLITHLTKLPTIGRKTAERMAFHLLKSPEIQVEELAAALVDMKRKLKYCTQCFNITEEIPCAICCDESRENGVICVIEEPMDALALESSGTYQGRYHVLGGRLSPLKGITASDLNINALDTRLEKENVKELILATNPSVDGEATALYLKRHYAQHDVQITRIALGLPVGGSLEYADEQTLQQALNGRTSMS